MNPLRKKKPKPPLISPEWRKRLLIAVAVAVCVSLLGYGAVWGVGWVKRHPSPPPAGAKPVELVKYVVSDSFDKLRLSQKEEYFEKLRPAPGVDPREAMKGLSEAERGKVFEKMMAVREARMKKEAKDYFSLPKDQRAAWMASHIAEQDKRRAEMRERFRQMREQRQAQGGQQQGAQGSSGGQRPEGGPPGGGPDGGPGGPPP